MVVEGVDLFRFTTILFVLLHQATQPRLRFGIHRLAVLSVNGPEQLGSKAMSIPNCRIINIPGPAGATGMSGVNGADGSPAFTALSAPFTMPAQLGQADATVDSVDFMAIGEPVFIEGLGTLQIINIVGATVTLYNLQDGSGAYNANSPPGTVAPATARVTPTGWQGEAGLNGAGSPTDATYLLQTANVALPNAQNLSALATGLMEVSGGTGVVSTKPTGVADGAVAPVNQGGGLVNGRALFATASGIESKTAVNAQSALGLGSMAVQNANAVNVTGGTVAGITDLALADGGTGASTSTAAQDNLGKLLPRYGLLGSLTAVDLNVGTNDNAVAMRSLRYRIDKITVENASVNLTTATAGVFTLAGGLGTTLAADQVLSALTASTKFLDITLAAVAGTDVVTAGTIYFRVGTPQGVAATANVWVWGWRYD